MYCVNCPKSAIFKPPQIYKKNHRWNICFNLSSEQQYFLADFKKSVKTASEKVEINVDKVKHPEHNYSAIFSESRNNKFVFKKRDDSTIIYKTYNNKKPILEEHQKGQLATNRVVSS